MSPTPAKPATTTLTGLAASMIATALLCPALALADPRLDEKVYAPYVERGALELESRTAGEVAGPIGGAVATVIEAEYGVSDRVSASLVGRFSREATGPLSLNAVGLEAVAYLGQIPGVGIDTGLYLEVEKGVNGGESGGEAKLLLAKTAGRFQGLVNLIVERPFGVPRGEGYASYGYAASVTWRTVGKLRLGVEAFGDLGSDRAFLGRQGAYVGPQIKWSFRPHRAPVEFGVDAGWLASVGTSRGEADSQFRLVLEAEHRF